MADRTLVHIIDDDDAVRDSLKAVLEGAGFGCVGYASARGFLSVAQSAAGCALVDVRMPEMDGIALLKELTARGVNIPVVIMTGFADVPLAVKAMREGAVDFVEKPAPRDVLLEAVKRALDRAEPSEDASAEKREAAARLARLTQRELEVLECLVAGDANKVTAHKLGISPRTVEIHRGRLMEKTQAKSLAELVRIALAAGVASHKQ
jgi:two-component system response regulator FixJ